MPASPSADHGWNPLFNGRDLTGWTVKCLPADRDKTFWRVENGAIACDSIGRKDHDYVWLVSEHEFDDFVLELEFQAFRDSPGNGGVQVRSRYDASPDAPRGGWLDGPQIDIHPPAPWRTGLIYDETREERRWIFPSLKDAKIDPSLGPKETRFFYAGDSPAWNRLRIECHGTRIQTSLNGWPVADLDGSGVLNNSSHATHRVGLSGHIALQLHARDELRIRFREIRVRANLSNANTPDRAARIGSWGDQGDGTYRNPILNADYPDVDIERADDTYYLITSSMHYAPGMTIAESRDLVNWRLIGHVFDRLTWHPSYNWDRMGGSAFGVWAGDLAYHDGTWFCYFIDARHGLYVSTAKDIRGPWSEAKLMLAKENWTDPAVFWDDRAKQAYLVCNYGRDPQVKDQDGSQTRLFKMSWDGLSLVDQGTGIYYGTGVEAAKIYRREGTWYIFLVKWMPHPGANFRDRKQLVLRGPSPYGPFEERVVMEMGNGVNRPACQGALVQAPDGSWWYSHQLVQEDERSGGRKGGASFGGRPQHLIPVRWQDGWPVMGEDPDGNGIGNTVIRHRKPIDGFPIAAPQTDDGFESSQLGPQWQWHHNPRDSHWSLEERPGWLRLKASVPAGDGGFWNAPNTISQRLMGTTKGQVIAKLDFSGAAPGMRAGVCHHSGQFVLLGVRVTANGKRHVEFDRNGNVIEGPELPGDTLYIRTTIDGHRARFAYSPDNATWTNFGPEFLLTFGRWKGDRLGCYCWNDASESGHLDIDWFSYEYDGPKGAR